MHNTLKRVRVDDLDYRYFGPEDLAAMRHAYYTACRDRPKAVQTHHQRMMLAKAIVVIFDSTLPESEIIDAALLMVSNSYA
ncbi:MAG: hypothetical protein Q8L53_13165 [Aestuariivirga sp.]|nr:hypothetical protein [Aestuariivirga sp.]